MSDPNQPPQADPAVRIVSHTVDQRDEGERADVVLGRRIPALSRRVARSLARSGKLRVDGRRQAAATRVSAGQLLELELEQDDAPPAVDLTELEILATTERFIYVHKPAGVHTIALTPAQPGVLATAVAERWPECATASKDLREGGAVHRLDQPTSGVVAFARSPEVWAEARAGFRDERVAKHYLAACARRGDRWPPDLPEGGLRGWIEPADRLVDFADQLAPLVSEGAGQDAVRVRAAIGRDGGHKRSAVRLDGRRASTVVQPLEVHADRWLVRLLLETGRRHQARVHLAWIGLPILDDPVYGDAPPHDGPSHDGPHAIHLHAFALDLSAIFADEVPVFAPPPPGFWRVGS